MGDENPSPQRRKPDPLSDINRQMPFSDEAEKGFLSCILQSPVELLDDARNKLPLPLEKEASSIDQPLYHPANLRLYQELLEMGTLSIPIDLVSISKRLLDKGDMDKIGGPAIIPELLSFVPTPAHWDHYIGILKEKRLLRRIIGTCTYGVQISYEFSEDPAGILDKIQTAILAISIDREQRGPVHIKAAVNQVIDASEKAMQSIKDGTGITGYTTGVSADIDRITNGIELGDRVGIGALSSTGKTAFVVTIAKNLARKYNAPGIIFSMDGEAVTLARRAIADDSDVCITEIRTGMGFFGEGGKIKQRAIMNAASEVGKLPIYIDDRAALTIQQSLAVLRSYIQRHGVKWAVWDFFQCLTCPGKQNGNNENRTAELTVISRLFKGACQDLHIAGIMLAQLNRDVKIGSRPSQQHVKDCGALYEDCNKFFMLSQETRSLSTIKQAEDPEIPEKDLKHAPPLELSEKLIICDVVKNKDGPTGPVWLRFNASKMRFNSLIPGKKIYDSTFNKDARNAEGRG